MNEIITKYAYSDAQFALSDEGMHLLRSGYCYKLITYPSIEKAHFAKLSPVRSPLLAAIAGIALVIFSLLQSSVVYSHFTDPDGRRIHIQAIIVIILPLFMGAYLLYLSVKREQMLIVVTDAGRKKLSVESLQATGKLSAAADYLGQKIGMIVL